jgi:hypothetical protein
VEVTQPLITRRVFLIIRSAVFIMDVSFSNWFHAKWLLYRKLGNMPCYGPDGPPNVRSDVAERRLAEAYKELDRATKAACELARLMPGYNDGVWDEISPGTIRWVKEHRKLDKKRSKK